MRLDSKLTARFINHLLTYLLDIVQIFADAKCLVLIAVMHAWGDPFAKSRTKLLRPFLYILYIS